MPLHGAGHFPLQLQADVHVAIICIVHLLPVTLHHCDADQWERLLSVVLPWARSISNMLKQRGAPC